jgi:translation initiation factor 3 subunit K
MSLTLPENSAAMQELIRMKTYESGTLTTLAAYAETQAKNKTYDFEANKALMKIYQCYPDLADADVIAKLLVLSMMRLPRNDFLMISYLIPQKISSSSPKIALVQKCAEDIEAGRFADFWVSFGASASGADSFPAAGFLEAIRGVIAENVQATFRTISTTMFQEMLGFSSSSELSAFCGASQVVQEVKDGVVIMKSCAETLPRLQHFEEGLHFEDAMKIISSMRKLEA